MNSRPAREGDVLVRVACTCDPAPLLVLRAALDEWTCSACGRSVPRRLGEVVLGPGGQLPEPQP